MAYPPTEKGLKGVSCSSLQARSVDIFFKNTVPQAQKVKIFFSENFFGIIFT